MKASSVSTAAISQALRYSHAAHAERPGQRRRRKSSTGKVADTGLALGARTAQVVNFTRDLDRLNGIVDSNALVSVAPVVDADLRSASCPPPRRLSCRR